MSPKATTVPPREPRPSASTSESSSASLEPGEQATQVERFAKLLRELRPPRRVVAFQPSRGKLPRTQSAIDRLRRDLGGSHSREDASAGEGFHLRGGVPDEHDAVARERRDRPDRDPGDQERRRVDEGAAEPRHEVLDQPMEVDPGRGAVGIAGDPHARAAGAVGDPPPEEARREASTEVDLDRVRVPRTLRVLGFERRKYLYRPSESERPSDGAGDSVRSHHHPGRKSGGVSVWVRRAHGHAVRLLPHDPVEPGGGAHLGTRRGRPVPEMDVEPRAVDDECPRFVRSK